MLDPYVHAPIGRGVGQQTQAMETPRGRLRLPGGITMMVMPPRFCPGKPWDSSMLQPERIPPAFSNERRLPRHSASDHQSRSSTLRRFEIQVVRRANQARGIERVNTDPSPGPPELAVTSPP